MLEPTDISRIWSKLDSQRLYIIVLDSALILEPPEGIDDDVEFPEVENPESVMRVFLDLASAELYAEALEMLTPGGYVVEVNLAQLWDMISNIHHASTTQYGCPARIDISTMRVGDPAQSIDVLWSEYFCFPDQIN